MHNNSNSNSDGGANVFEHFSCTTIAEKSFRCQIFLLENKQFLPSQSIWNANRL